MRPESRKAGSPIVVVKLGGSLANNPRLPLWLRTLGAGGGRAVIVPGGGPFADQVRELQQKLCFDDATAHHLAILAMEQFGRILAALQPGLVPAINRDEIGSVLRSDQVPVWMPAAMTIGNREIAESWDITSDSLAAWLAGDLSARDLVLVKSAVPPTGAMSAAVLAEQGLVDPAFPEFLKRSRAKWHCLGPNGEAELAAILGNEAPIDDRVVGGA